MTVDPPELPELEHVALDSAARDGELILEGALVDGQDSEPANAERVLVTESELHGVAISGANAPGLRFSDVILRGCDLSNIDGREGSLHRVEIYTSRLTGFVLDGGRVQDLRAADSSLMLASLAFCKLRNVIFERVDLTEASFLEAQLRNVTFIDCKLSGADFRGGKFNACTIRGTSLDGVLGVDSLKGVAMPWVDVLESAGALAAALGIIIEAD